MGEIYCMVPGGNQAGRRDRADGVGQGAYEFSPSPDGFAVAVMQFEFDGQQVLGIEGADGNAYVVGMEVGNVLGTLQPRGCNRDTL